MQNSILLMLVACTISLSCKSAIKVSQEYKTELETYRHSQLSALTEGDSPVLTAEIARQLNFYEIDPVYQVTAEILLTQDATPFSISTYSGVKKNYLEYAKAIFEIYNEEASLIIYRDLKMINIPGFNQKLFLMFKDLTNGETTYGGGRYLYLDTRDVLDNSIIIDFNKSFNPYCAYADGFNCPIPPPENHLAIKISAGEKNFIVPE